ncbi:hypothetical protein CEXT_261261 [Caerostris extrusa]|uniref:Uncharacterized protein n=1 Tax=Caerostris extrusa TaxID=172846 RepID=A0AAV4U0D4_CAEEX|nr:hypothetical protein CEXT_261261 [Caerostris extrusa]
MRNRRHRGYTPRKGAFLTLTGAWREKPIKERLIRFFNKSATSFSNFPARFVQKPGTCHVPHHCFLRPTTGKKG